MDGLVMSELAEPEELAEPQLNEVAPKRKRVSGYDRMKRKNQYLAKGVGELTKDVAALENLVETLLKHLETAISPDVTSEDRERVTQMISGVRAALTEDEAGVSASERH